MTQNSDFASAAMMRLVVAGLTAQGIRLPVPAPAGAHVARSGKRALLDEVLAELGPNAILSISNAVPALPPEPVVIALRAARTVRDLLDRWGRLETFSHARHRVEVTDIASGQIKLHHVSLLDSLSPSLAESLLVLGLITWLCESLGARHVTLMDRSGHIWRNAGRWVPKTGNTDLGPLTLTFEEGANRDSVLADFETDPDSLRQTMAEDPLRRWSVGSLADHAQMSKRSLQRKLTERCTSFSRLLSEARLQAAAARLCAPEQASLAEIGFLSGFADQAHFSRDFKKGVGTTPRAYRAAFRSDP